MKNSFEKEAQENPEVKMLYSYFQHHLGHFLLTNRLGRELGKDTYDDVEQLQKGNEFIDKLLAVSQNEALVSVLQEIKSMLSGIDINSKQDVALLARADELLDVPGREKKY